jgi:prepilin-type N-terminal cleavage/methylation domain-containing protein
MKALPHSRRNTSSLGFSLIELMLVLVIISLVLGAILGQVVQVQQRATAEKGKVDDIQEARDFFNLVSLDTRQMGFPNVHQFEVSQGTWQSPLVNDYRLAGGLVKLSATQLEFQGDVDGSGNVSVVSYMVNGNGGCSTCVQRAQVLKVNGDPITGQTNLTASAYNTVVQYVQNTTAVFSAYDGSGNPVTLPIDIDSVPTTVANVRVIQVQLDIANPTVVDPQTGQELERKLVGEVQVANCSMATTGLAQPDGVQITCQ